MASFWTRFKSKPTPAGGHPRPRRSPIELVKQLFKGGIFLSMLLVILVCSAALVGWILRFADPSTQIIVTGVTGPFTQQPDASTVFGKQASDIFSDHVNDVIQEGSGFVGNSLASANSKAALSFDPIPKIPVSKSYGIEIKGVSVDEILSLWNRIRYNQEEVSGDIIPVGGGTGKFVLYLSMRYNDVTRNWESPAFGLTGREFANAVENAAETFVRKTNPETAGRYYLSQAQVSQGQSRESQYNAAMSTFSEWMSLEPSRPEPYVYIARTLDLQGDYDRAEPFGETANSLLSNAPWKTRGHLKSSIFLVRSLAYVQSNNISDFEKLADKELRKEPNALVNLGLMYQRKAGMQSTTANVDVADFGASIDKFKAALRNDKGNFAAAYSEGASYTAESDLADAAKAYETALAIRPLSADAAVGYLATKEAMNDFATAAQYCKSWVFPVPGGSGIINDVNNLGLHQDLYFVCAQAQHQANPGGSTALEWYYAEFLDHPDTEDAAREVLTLDPDLLTPMHDSLCRPQGDEELPGGIGEEKLAEAAKSLADRIGKEINKDKQALSEMKEPKDRAPLIADQGLRSSQQAECMKTATNSEDNAARKGPRVQATKGFEVAKPPVAAAARQPPSVDRMPVAPVKRLHPIAVH